MDMDMANVCCFEPLVGHPTIIDVFGGAEVTLELRGDHIEVAGGLIVKLRETDLIQAGRDAVSAAQRDVTDSRIATPIPALETVGNMVGRVTDLNTIASPVVDSLKFVIEKSKVVVDTVNQLAKVRIAVVS